MGLGWVTVKLTPLLATPDTVTTTFPVVAPLGTVVAMLVEVQLVVDAVVPLKVTVPDDPKFVPVIVTGVPTGPEVVDRLVMLGDDPPPPEAALNVATCAVHVPAEAVHVPAIAPALA